MNGGERVGPYSLTSLLRSGGGGSVYRATDSRNGRVVALKTAHAAHPHTRAGLRREVATLLMLQVAGVDGVVKVLDHGEDDSAAWFAMTLIDGPSLGDVQRSLWGEPPAAVRLDTPATAPTAIANAAGTPDASSEQPVARIPREAHRAATPRDAHTVRRALAIGKRIAETLGRVHALGLLHGDLSPSNILLGANDSPVLLDFGTSYAVFEQAQFREPSRQAFERYGTPGYIAPEVLLGESMDLRCDVYSLGCVLHELLYGVRPFSGVNAEDLAERHCNGTLRLPQRPDVPAQLGRVILQMLTMRAEQRISDLQLVVSALGDALGEQRRDVRVPHRTTLLRPRLVGRELVKQQLWGCVNQTQQAHGSVVLVAAQSGAGKTRLLNEIGLAANASGFAVISCQATPAVGSGEFASASSGLSLLLPVVRYAQQLALDDGGRHAETSARIDALLSILQAHLPRTRVSVDDGNKSQSASDTDKASKESARQRSFDALEQLLQLLAERHPTLLLLDDVQWADELSLAFLGARAELLTQHRILCIVSMRADAEPARAQSIANWVQHRVQLPALDVSSSAALVKELLGTETLPEGLLDYVESTSEGNPFFIGEHLRAALGAGMLQQREDGDWTFPTPSELKHRVIEVPRNVDESIGRRLEALSPTGRRVLARAAVLGREFDEQLLTAQLEDPGLATAIALQELVARQLVVQVAPERYRFAHDRLREAAERALPSDVRRGLHQSAASALETSSAARTTSTLARLGHHWSTAAEPTKALHYFETAARYALEENDVDFACELYRSAVSEVTQLPHESFGPKQAALNEALGDALVLRARYNEGRQSFVTAFENTTAADGLLRARLKRKEASTHWTQHEYAAAERVLRDAEAALESAASERDAEYWQEHIQIQIGRFEYLYFSQRSGAEIDELIQSLEQPIATWGNPRQRNIYYVAASNHALMRSRYAYREDAVALAAKAVDASGSLVAQQQALAHLAYGFALEKGSLQQRQHAVTEMNEAMVLATQAQATTLQSRVATYHLLVLRRLGDTEGTTRLLPLARAVAEASRLPPYVAAADAAAGWVAWRTGAPNAKALLQRARASWLGHPHPYPFRWLAAFPLLDIALGNDELDDVQAMVREILEPVQQALPDALTEQLRAVEERCVTVGAQGARSELDRALRIASALDYC